MLAKVNLFMLKYNYIGGAMARNAKKVKTKAKINWGWDAPESRTGKATRSTKKKIDITDEILIILLVTLIGGAIGVGACWFVGRNDKFEIVGKEELTLTLRNEDETVFTSKNSYVDEGVKIVSFGRDISDSVYIETDMKRTGDGRFYADEIGTYYIIYKTKDIKYGKLFTVERIRLVTFVEPTPEYEVD